jgi:hypothetical protein
MKRKEFLKVAGVGGIMLGSGMLITACQKESFLSEGSDHNTDVNFRQGGIHVEPLEINFGDVPVGVQVEMEIRVENHDPGDFLQVDAIALTSNHEFVILEQPSTPVFMFPDEVFFIRVGFTPSAVETYNSSVVIYSTDFNNPIVEVFLSGTGVEELPPAPADPIELNSYYTTAIDNGEIAVLNADFSKKVDLAATFFEKGKIKQACKKLDWLYQRCDGAFPPPDMITGEGVAQFREYLLGVMEELGCN